MVGMYITEIPWMGSRTDGTSRSLQIPQHLTDRHKLANQPDPMVVAKDKKSVGGLDPPKFRWRFYKRSWRIMGLSSHGPSRCRDRQVVVNPPVIVLVDKDQKW